MIEFIFLLRRLFIDGHVGVILFMINKHQEYFFGQSANVFTKLGLY